MAASHGSAVRFTIMRKIKIVLGVALLALAVSAGWQMWSAYYGNLELKEDLRDIAADVGTRIGLSQPPSQDDLRKFVIAKAAGHDIQLEPDQVTVKVAGEGKAAVISLAVDYSAPISLLIFSFNLHFNASSAR